MSDLPARNEIMLLAHEIGLDEQKLAFLVDQSPEDLRDLRGLVSAALFGRHERRFHRVAALSNVLPAPMTAKIAQAAFGPAISGRVAGVLETADAVRLARQMSPEFLIEVAPSLDPGRVAGIVANLPHDLIVKVGKGLLHKGSHLVLGRFVAVAPLRSALGVAHGEAPVDLLHIAMFCEDKTALEPLVHALDPEVVRGVIAAAADADSLDDALTLLAALSPQLRGQLIEQVATLPEEARNRLVHRVIDLKAWDDILPAFEHVSPTTLALLVNVPATLSVEVIDEVLARAMEIGRADVLIPTVLAFDDDHLDALESSTVLTQPAVQEWLLSTSGVAARLVSAVLKDLVGQ